MIAWNKSTIGRIWNSLKNTGWRSDWFAWEASAPGADHQPTEQYDSGLGWNGKEQLMIYFMAQDWQCFDNCLGPVHGDWGAKEKTRWNRG